jgi:hypothetical protein
MAPASPRRAPSWLAAVAALALAAALPAVAAQGVACHELGFADTLTCSRCKRLEQVVGDAGERPRRRAAPRRRSPRDGRARERVSQLLRR